MSNHRYSKFWWQDWQGDSSLRSCGLAARGLWMELLCVAHSGTPVGHVTLNGRPATNRQLAAIVGATEKEVDRLITELENAGVFSRTETGEIFSRRMVRDAGRAEAGATEVRKKWGTGEQSGQSRTSRMTEARRKGTHTPEEWHAMLQIIGDRCLRCGRPADDNGGGLVKDHIVPIYQGGSDSIDNIQPMCRSCNAAKGPDTTDHRPHDWRKRLGQCLGERLGTDQKMPRSVPRGTTTLYSESEAEAEPPRSPPVPGGLARRASKSFRPPKNAFHDLAREFDAEMAQQAATIDGNAEEVADLQAFRRRLAGGARG